MIARAGLLLGWALLFLCMLPGIAAKADGPLKVAAVFGTTVEEPWVDAIHSALQEAAREERVDYVWSDRVAPDEMASVLRDFAAQGFDLITGDSFGAETAARQVAREFPDTAFAFGSGGGPAAPNFSVFDNWIHESAYLAGMI
ncbi:MAG: BMP family ABC transporter substrate-binding protein, partial [Pseudomonadota bacterium]